MRLSVVLFVLLLALMFVPGSFAETWQWQNPIPDGNPITHMAFADSLTGWAVGGNGTIFKTTDGGLTWAAQNAQTQVRFEGVACVGPDRVWATGYNWRTGRGTVAKSVDGGQTWLLQYGWQYIWFKQIFYTDSLHGWLVGDGQIFHTSNGGRTYQGQFLNYDMSFYGFTARDSLTAFAVGYDYGGNAGAIMRTVDGQTWQRVEGSTAGHLYDISFGNADSGWAVAYDGHMLNTTNGGENWTDQPSTVSPRRVHFRNAQEGWIACQSGVVLHTVSGGVAWDTVTIPTKSYPEDIFFAHNRTGWICGTAGNIFRTTDGGQNWVRRGSGVEVWLNDICFADTLRGWACGSWGTVMQTTNGGAQWQVQNTGTTHAIAGLAFIDAQEGWGCGTVGTVIHTTDGGANWQMQTTPVTSELDRMVFADSRHGWIVGVDGVILHTSNGGASWEQQQSPTSVNVWSVSCIDSLRAWAVGYNDASPREGDILRTTDGGETWELQMQPPQSNLWSICMQDSLSGWIAGYYSYSGYGALWHTTDGGVTWPRTTTTVPATFLGLKVRGPLIMTASSWGSIQRSTDGGASWLSDTTGTDNVLFGMALPSATQAWTCGDGGSILHWQAAATAVTERPEVVHAFALTAYPNPFNPQTVIELNLPRTQRVRISVFDLEGRLVTILADRVCPAGAQRFLLDGSRLSSGTYFARAESGDLVKTMRLMLLK